MNVLCTVEIVFAASLTLLGATSVWQQPGKVQEGDWEVIDATGEEPLYLEIVRHEVLVYQPPSDFRIMVQRVLMVQKKTLDNVAKYKITFSFQRSRCAVEEDYNKDECRPHGYETTGQCTLAMREYLRTKERIVEWLQCMDYV
ncbi:uncharacterized protein LOC119375634 [Rhipicephalus sanguineus]|uniref:uncharacterized protein LOC119375634 n=1 Tax=Rhipicephalus sanguineus TaxID=34632 RepID=UPI0018951085|nr:uncharacterized protein LOC119375634 [Rhipicephalus sanguineus]